MKVINLGESNSVLNSFVAQMRDRKIQKNSLLSVHKVVRDKIYRSEIVR